MLFPFYWMLITSIKPNRELYSQKIMPLIVYQPTLKHYVDLLTETNFLTWTYNTMLVAVVTTVVSLVLGTMIAYPLARMNFPGAAVVAIGVAATYLVPQPLLFIPMSDIINRLGAGQHAHRRHAHLPHAADPVLRLAADGLLQERAARAGGGRAHRRGQPLPGDDAHRAAAVHARAAVGRDLLLHPGPERVPLRADLPGQERGAHGAGRRRSPS